MNQGRTAATIFFLLGAVIAIGWYWFEGVGDGQPEPEVTATPIPVPDTPPPDEAVVESVVDAITVRLETGHVVRYLGVKPPEVKEEVQCFGREALLANESIIGETVRLETDPLLERSRDGAWTRYVFFTPGEKNNDQTPSPNAQINPNDQISNNDNETFENSLKIDELETENSNESNVVSESADVNDAENEIFINERILEGGFAFPVLAEDMEYGERMLSAARYASATGKGLWSQCEVEEVSEGTFETKEVEDCIIKGKQAGGQRIYRLPECRAYGETVALESEGGAWFCSEEEAQEAGFSLAPDCL